jgi:serine acetyltransferase
VILLTHASIIGPVVVGNHVLIGAHALVLDDMPDGSRPKGVPARP